jgi:hypothetical protein
MPMEMDDFARVNKERCTKGFKHTLEKWSAADWYTATSGELGEAGNIVKKLNRIRDGIKNAKQTKSKAELTYDLAMELADTYIYLDLFAQALGYTLSDIVAIKFNADSVANQLPQRAPHTEMF